MPGYAGVWRSLMSNSAIRNLQESDGYTDVKHVELMRRLQPALDSSSRKQSRLHVISTLTRDGIEGLAAAIVARAALDWAYEPPDAKAYIERADREMALLQRTNPGALEVLGEEHDGDASFGSLQEELMSFWHGEEGTYLRDYFGLSWLDLDDIAP
jgi:hypothetical protein